MNGGERGKGGGGDTAGTAHTPRGRARAPRSPPPRAKGLTRAPGARPPRATARPMLGELSPGPRAENGPPTAGAAAIAPRPPSSRERAPRSRPLATRPPRPTDGRPRWRWRRRKGRRFRRRRARPRPRRRRRSLLRRLLRRRLRRRLLRRRLLLLLPPFLAVPSAWPSACARSGIRRPRARSPHARRRSRGGWRRWLGRRGRGTPTWRNAATIVRTCRRAWRALWRACDRGREVGLFFGGGAFFTLWRPLSLSCSPPPPPRRMGCMQIKRGGVVGAWGEGGGARAQRRRRGGAGLLCLADLIETPASPTASLEASPAAPRGGTASPASAAPASLTLSPAAAVRGAGLPRCPASDSPAAPFLTAFLSDSPLPAGWVPQGVSVPSAATKAPHSALLPASSVAHLDHWRTVPGGAGGAAAWRGWRGRWARAALNPKRPHAAACPLPHLGHRCQRDGRDGGDEEGTDAGH